MASYTGTRYAYLILYIAFSNTIYADRRSFVECILEVINMKILKLYEQTNLDLNMTITLSTNSGGVVAVQIYDALLFIEEVNLKSEQEFLSYLVSQEKPTQESIVSFLKHLFFDSTLAKQFVQWQRNDNVA